MLKESQENQIDIWLDKNWFSININKIDIPLLSWLIYQDDNTDIWYWPKRGFYRDS